MTRLVTYWWLSFVDRIDQAVAVQLGVAIVPATSLEDAIDASHRMGCNPGGEVAGHPLPSHVRIPYQLACRLLDAAEAAEASVALLGGTP